MKINLENGKYIDITIWQNEKGAYEYYNDGVLIGVFDPNVMQDSKFLELDIEKNNILPKKLTEEDKEINKKILTQIKEKINEMKLEDLEEEASDNQEILKYMEKSGISKKQIKSIKKFDLQREKENEENKEEHKNKQNDKKKTKKINQKNQKKHL